MKTYVMIDGFSIKFKTLAEAADYATSTENDSYGITVYDNETDEYIEYGKIERNEYSGDFVYNAVYLGISKDTGFDNADWYQEWNTEREALESPEAQKALANGYYIRADLVSTTTTETIETASCGTVYSSENPPQFTS